MGERWRRMTVVGALALGVFLGSFYAGCTGQPSVQGQQSLEQELYGAVERYLAGKVPPRDQPKRVIDYTEIGEKRYRVHMQMVEGEGWFEVWWDGQQWQAKGLPVPTNR